MPNPTVRGNLKLIQELQEACSEMSRNTISRLKALQGDQAAIASALLKMTEIMTQEHVVRDMLTHRAKWQVIQKQLKEIANAKNTEGRRDGEDSDTD